MMERLTGYENITEHCHNIPLVDLQLVFDRLAAYEDTGLTPEQVKAQKWISVKDGIPENEEDAVPVVYGRYCIDIVDFIDWLDVGHLRSADEKCFSEANVAGMLKDFAITNPAIPATVTRCKDCRYGLPCKLFGRDAITCTEHREEIHLMDWYCADAAKTDGKDDAK